MTIPEAGERTPQRAIKMHEFLMSGGVQVGYNEAQIMQYSEPITTVTMHDYPSCPWHLTEDCEAWKEILAGRGEWTRMETELAQLQSQLNDAPAEEVDALAEKILELTETLEMRPRDFKALRERTPEMIARERAASQKARREFSEAAANAAKAALRATDPKLRAAAEHEPSIALRHKNGTVDEKTVLCSKHTGFKDRAIFTADDDTILTDWVVVPKARYACFACASHAPEKVEGAKKTGNPWDRVDAARGGSEDKSWHTNTTGGPHDRPSYGSSYGGGGYSKYEPPKKPFVPDSRDKAIAEFATSEGPDVIEIDDEGDEGSE